ncbi:SDR family NAD(P)-dependent oxidoreductase [Sphingobium aromaticiconvertens]|uniref:SDR family NAD(P)-dependent oxidoreductase n=1 Tax=Sphingobium aromaticiconvertens TaxID=365341 RepID=UPI00301687D9
MNDRSPMNAGTERLTGRIVIVTGAASRSGIGFATARRIGAERAIVILTDLNGLDVEARAAELRSMGIAAEGIAQDVTDEQGWSDLIADVVDRHGRLDGLVNNAGIVILAPVGELSLDDWNKQVDVNMTSVFLGCRAAMGHMRRIGNGGAIVNVSSVAGLVGMRRTAAYSASKGGVRLMSKSLALEGAPDAIRVNSVHPGVIETDIQNGARSGSPSDSAAIAAAIPLGHTGRPDYLADAIAFLLSSDAAYITGTELIVDGGLTAQ